MREDVPLKWIGTWVLLTIVGFLILYINLMAYKYESIGKVHLLHMLNQKIAGVSREYLFAGFCEENVLLVGLYYNLIYGEPFYIINYPVANHVAVVVDNTLYTTARLEHPFKIVYKCEIDESLRKDIMTTDNRTLFSIVINRLTISSPVVVCELVPSIHYDKKVLYAGVGIYPWDKIVEWYYGKEKNVIEKIIVT